MQAIDTPFSVVGHVSSVINSGRHGFLRYISPNTASFPAKRLTSAEIEEIHAHGGKVGLVWESGFPTSGNYFTQEQADQDAQGAIEICEQLGIPSEIPVFFAADYDATPTDVTDYFRVVHAKVKESGRLIGVYGSGDVCSTLARAGIAHYTWLAQSRGWGGFGGWEGEADIVQGPSSTVGGLSVDTDLVVNALVMW